jgi:amino-acid N-acetyltransferase
MGFTTAAHQDLPDKIHKDCYQCPRLYRCDEIAMIRGKAPAFAILPPPKNWLKIQA